MFKIILLIIPNLAIHESAFVIQTSLGEIKGISRSVNDDKNTYHVSVFRKIPYAKAPIGELRFKRPVPFGKWTGVRDGTEYGPSCIQPPPGKIMSSLLPNLDQSEDCLHLNIFSPHNASNTNQKAVMVWIHGGAFITGQGTVYDGTYLSGIGDVVVVTINYRLNVFGFFSTMNDHSPGNYGIWDQQMALRWVHDNIGDYGGDNNSVTIFGESAGGFSVGLHAIQPENKGLFKRVIAQSGVGSSLLTTSPRPRYASKEYVNMINCPPLLDGNTITCLRNKTSDELLKVFIIMLGLSIFKPEIRIEMGFAPVVDGKYLQDSPENIMYGKGHGFSFFSSLDVVIGNSESEGSLLVSVLKIRKAKDLLETGISWQYLCNTIISTIVSDYYGDRKHLKNSVCSQYKTSPVLQSMSAVDFIGDIFFYSPAIKNLDIHAATSNKSHFQYLSKRLSIFSVSQRRAKWFTGAGHASELPFLFPFSNLSDASSDDRTSSILMMKYWSNFAKNGNVNGEGLPKWPQYDPHNKSYAILDVNVTIQHNLYKDRMDFWLQEMPALLNQTNTHVPNGNDGRQCRAYILTFTLIMLFNALNL